MTHFKMALSTLSLLFLFGASTQATPAQSLPASIPDCAIQNTDARPLTMAPADWPGTVPSVLHAYLRGPAIVQFEITAEGVPQNAKIVKSTGFYQLDRAALDVVLSQRYAPAFRGCMPADCTYLYEVDF